MQRPRAITFLAALELCRAGLLAIFAGVVFLFPEALSGASSPVRLLVSLASNRVVYGATLLNTIPFAIRVLLYSSIHGILGGGLLFLKKWARWGLMLSCGLLCVRVARSMLIRDFVRGQPTVFREGSTALALLVVNALIFFYLIQSDVRSVFESERGTGVSDRKGNEGLSS